MSELNGVLAVDKPEGPTSHDVVATARRALRIRRIGHTGTLDPFASGLLLLCLGPSTRLAEYLTALPKRYAATVRLGMATETDDRTGSTVSESDAWRALSAEAVESALAKQIGTVMQRPPAYSAKKVGGERMYQAARRGEVVEQEAVPVRIASIDVTRIALPEVDLVVECGSGTYIRAIARDLGEALGVGGHLTRLRRSGVGDFDVASALSLPALQEPESVARVLVPPAMAVAHLPRVSVDEQAAAALRHGRSIDASEGMPAGGVVAVVAGEGELLAICERSGTGLRPRKVFA